MVQARRAGGFRSGGYRGGFGGGFGGGGFGFSLTPWVKRLLILNSAIFLLMVVGLLPAGWMVRTFGFAPSDLLHRPWSPLTYMFLHGGFWHLFMNMLALFFFGPPLERTWGGSYFLTYYLVAGLGGALLAVLLLPFMPEVGATTIGASGAVFGLLLAFALNWPEAPIYIWGIFPIKAKWFVGILGGFTLLATLSGGNRGVADWAHLGGLLTGFLFLRYGDRARRLPVWSRVRRGLEGLVRGDEDEEEGGPGEPVRFGHRRRGGRAADRARAGDRVGHEPTIRPGRRRRVDGDTLDEVDRILDKIRERGMDSLTEEERSFLDELSRRYQRSS